MKGPFFNERDISEVPRLLLAARLTATTDDVLVGLLVAAGLIAQGWLTPWRLRTCETNRLTTFTTTMWMVTRGHGRTADGWANASVTFTTSFTKLDIAVIKITDLTNGCITNLMDQANFAGRHADLGKIAFLGKQLGSATSRANELAAFAFFYFDVMN